MNKIKNAFYAVASLVALAPAVASAQWNPVNGMLNTNLADRTIGSLLTVILNYTLALVGILGVIGFVISGIMYLTSAGDEDQVDRAKKVMLYSIIGVVVALIGYVVVAALSQVFVRGESAF